MGKQIATIAVLAVVVIAAWYAILRPMLGRVIGKAKARKKEKTVGLSGVVNAQPVQNPMPVSQTAVEPEPVILAKNGNKNEVVVFLRDKFSSRIPCESAIQSAYETIGKDMDDDDMLAAAAKAGYSMLDVAKVMAKWNYSPSAIETKLDEEYEEKSPVIARVLVQVFRDKTPEDLLELILDVFDDEDELSDLIPVLSEVTDSPVVIGEMIHKKTSLLLATVISKLGLLKNQAFIAALTKKTEVDLADSDEYAALRNDDGENLRFEEAAVILASTGKKAGEILDAENQYDEFDFNDDEHRKAVFDALRPCGFTDVEILDALEEENLSSSTGLIVLAAIENDVSLDAIVKFLENWNDDLDNLWDTLKEAEVDVDRTVEIMYSLIPLDRRWGGKPAVPAEESSAQQNE